MSSELRFRTLHGYEEPHVIIFWIWVQDSESSNESLRNSFIKHKIMSVSKVLIVFDSLPTLLLCLFNRIFQLSPEEIGESHWSVGLEFHQIFVQESKLQLWTRSTFYEVKFISELPKLIERPFWNLNAEQETNWHKVAQNHRHYRTYYRPIVTWCVTHIRV